MCSHAPPRATRNGRPPITAHKRAPLGLLVAIGLIAVIEGTLASRESAFTTVWAAQWRWSGREATRSATRSDILCLGDSLVMHGIIPQALQLRLGRPTYNLAMSNAQMPACYFVLRRALDHGARPSALILDGEILDYHPLKFTRLWPELLSFPEALDLARTARDADFLANFLLSKSFPSIKTRHEIRESILAALWGQPLDRAAEVQAHQRNHHVNQGAQVIAAPAAVPEVDPWLDRIGKIPSDDWSCDPVNALYLDRLLALAAAREIPVFWVLPPTHPAFQERREKEGRDERYMAFTRKLLARYSHVTVIDGRHAGYARDVMADQSHLNQRGAWVFSASVADIVATRLQPGPPRDPRRWVETARFTPSPAGSQVEDLSRSRLVLEQEDRDRRLR